MYHDLKFALSISTMEKQLHESENRTYISCVAVYASAAILRDRMSVAESPSSGMGAVQALDLNYRWLTGNTCYSDEPSYLNLHYFQGCIKLYSYSLLFPVSHMCVKFSTEVQL